MGIWIVISILTSGLTKKSWAAKSSGGHFLGHLTGMLLKH